MSVDPVASSASSQSAAPTDAANTVPSANGTETSSKTSFRTVGDLMANKEFGPKFLQAIAEAIMRDVKRGGERVKEAMKKSRQV